MSDPLKTVGMVSAMFDILCKGEKDQAKVIEQRARFYKTQDGIIWPDDWDDLPLEEKKIILSLRVLFINCIFIIKMLIYVVFLTYFFKSNSLIS